MRNSLNAETLDYEDLLHGKGDFRHDPDFFSRRISDIGEGVEWGLALLCLRESLQMFAFLRKFSADFFSFFPPHF